MFSLLIVMMSFLGQDVSELSWCRRVDLPEPFRMEAFYSSMTGPLFPGGACIRCWDMDIDCDVDLLDFYLVQAAYFQDQE